MCPLLTEYGIFLSLPLLSQLSTIMMVTMILMRREENDDGQDADKPKIGSQ